MNENLYSNIIQLIKFPLICCIILYHCYTSVNINNDIYWHLVYPLITLGEVGVPAFFFISGLLFYYNVKDGHLQYNRKIKSRIKTLLIPYFIWNALMLILLFILESIPFTSSFFAQGYDQITGYNFFELIKAFVFRGEWNGGYSTPILSTMWYIRNLMVLCLISPIIYYMIRSLKWIVVITLGVWWISSIGGDYTQSSIFFFSLGACVMITRTDILNINKNNIIIFSLLYVFIFISDYIINMQHFTSFSPLIIHRINIITSIYALLLIGKYFSNKYKLSSIYTDSTFFIFAFHYPLVLAIRRVGVKLIHTNNGVIDFSIYLFSFILSVIICLFVYYLLLKYSPKILRILTGNRA